MGKLQNQIIFSIDHQANQKKAILCFFSDNVNELPPSTLIFIIETDKWKHLLSGQRQCQRTLPLQNDVGIIVITVRRGDSGHVGE